ncbi:hypothetical protein BDV25DRAFT_164124 [Aspergillus avenaceus]|uniref:Uncharacterized protein n=1 Tax=Aspergillus avenaceus TaxID=36643 RepID=A0A5N6TH78_ASPAV|nr:hypothetical protein BDV25DRAFT_164124 [Aspergillus avenaceus]
MFFCSAQCSSHRDLSARHFDLPVRMILQCPHANQDPWQTLLPIAVEMCNTSSRENSMIRQGWRAVKARKMGGKGSGREKRRRNVSTFVFYSKRQIVTDHATNDIPLFEPKNSQTIIQNKSKQNGLRFGHRGLALVSNRTIGKVWSPLHDEIASCQKRKEFNSSARQMRDYSLS